MATPCPDFTCPVTGFAFTRPERWAFMPPAWMHPEREAAWPESPAGVAAARLAEDPIAVCYRDHGSMRHINPTAQLFRRPWPHTVPIAQVLGAMQSHFTGLYDDAKFEVLTDHAMLAGARAAHYVVRFTQGVRVEDEVVPYRTRLTGYTLIARGHALTFTVATSTTKAYRMDDEVAALLASARFAQ